MSDIVRFMVGFARGGVAKHLGFYVIVMADVV